MAGALNQGPGEGGEEEDHGQVQHGHEEREVEALRGPNQKAGVEGLQPLSLLIMVAGAKPVLCMRSQLYGNPMQTRGVEATQKWQPRDSILAQFRHYHPC